MRRASCAWTRRRSRSRGLAKASSIACWVISWNTMRCTGHFGLEGLGQVPGDRLALAILVCRQIELVDPGQHLLQLLDPVFALFGHHVQRLELVVHVYPEARPILALGAGRDLSSRPGKVADVPHGRLDHHVRTEECGDGSSLGGGLDNDEALRH